MHALGRMFQRLQRISMKSYILHGFAFLLTAVLIFLSDRALHLWFLWLIATPAVPAVQRLAHIEILRDRLVSEVGLFHGLPSLVLWSTNLHIGPILDLKHLLTPEGVVIIDHSLSSRCWLTKTCASRLKVLSMHNAMRPTKLQQETFYKTYAHNSRMSGVDAVLCFHPASICQVYIPFNKSLIVFLTNRYELGRESVSEWQQWNQDLLSISTDSKNSIVANNLYDAKYVQYFTGIEPMVIPNACGYTKAKYKPSRKTFLLFSVHKKDFEAEFLLGFIKACSQLKNCSAVVRPMRSLYKQYTFQDLAAHPGIVYTPHQVAFVSMAEHYAMGIPLFFPSLDLLTQWQLKHQVVMERTLEGSKGKVPHGSKLPPHPSQTHLPDPNSDVNLKAISYWLQYAEFYQRPHIVLYNSFRDLAHKLIHSNLTQISEAMRNYTEILKEESLLKWRHVMVHTAEYSSKFSNKN